jgi:hypothetical protein
MLLQHLNEALTERTDAAIGDRIKLRDAVCAYVMMEQAKGIPIDRVILAVDAILETAEEGVARESGVMRRRDDALAEQLVQWCLGFSASGTSGDALT